MWALVDTYVTRHVDGIRRPNFLSQASRKIVITSDAYLHFRFRKLPRDSAGFRRIYMCGVCRNMPRGMWKSKVYDSDFI